MVNFLRYKNKEGENSSSRFPAERDGHRLKAILGKPCLVRPGVLAGKYVGGRSTVTGQ